MQINNAQQAEDYFSQGGNYRKGDRDSRVLITGVEASPANYKFGWSTGRGEQSWETPRHRHNFEQIRYVIEGDYSMTKTKSIPAGAVGYFSESCYYGPQVKNPNLTMLTVQYGGPSGYGYVNSSQRKAALEALRQRGGTFNNGIYTWVDDKGTHHNQDGAEAIYEQVSGQKLIYPPARYDEIIVMHPDNFAWIPLAGQPGVERRLLGAFTERDVRIAFLRLETGATLTFGTERSVELMFLTEGELAHAGQKYGPQSAFGTSADDGAEQLTATEPTVLFYAKLPTF
jgi:hypothetical protein